MSGFYDFMYAATLTNNAKKETIAAKRAARAETPDVFADSVAAAVAASDASAFRRLKSREIASIFFRSCSACKSSQPLIRMRKSGAHGLDPSNASSRKTDIRFTVSTAIQLSISPKLRKKWGVGICSPYFWMGIVA